MRWSQRTITGRDKAIKAWLVFHDAIAPCILVGEASKKETEE